MSIEKNKNNISLPSNAKISINHCNLPASILGGLTYNNYPVPLLLDGVNEIHKNLFDFLKIISNFHERRSLFYEYMQAHFQLNDLSQMGYSEDSSVNRIKINYKRIIFGWHMNPDGLEGAVLKRWSESRFGLIPRYHKTSIRHYSDPAYESYLVTSSAGTYNTNAIEAQLDVLYSYTQFELSLNSETHIKLYRGVNHLDEHEILNKKGNDIIILLNNINSFSSNARLAEQFGDHVLTIDVPTYKVFCFNHILPAQINTEEEYIVIGGLYHAYLR